MSVTEQHRPTPAEIRNRQIQDYWASDLSRRVYLLRRQKKAVFENCRRIAVIGVSADPAAASYVSVEKLLGLALEIIPIFPDRVTFLGLRCFPTLREVPGKIDILQVYPNNAIDLVELARAAVDRKVTTFWVEQAACALREVEAILANGQVQLVEYETLEHEYLKHMPYGPVPSRRDKKAAKVKERMARNPTTVRPSDGLNEALERMERGQFRHLPVVDDSGNLLGMLSDRDIRLIRPSLAFVSREDADAQLWSLAVQQAAVFDPVKVAPETTLKEAAGLMLRWHVGGLPVVNGSNKLIGVITYTDLLRELIQHE
jgi:acetoin utilization protein AcuB